MISSPISKEEVCASPASIRLVEESGPLEIAQRVMTSGQIPRHHVIEEEAHRPFTTLRDGRRVHDEVRDDQSIIITAEDGGFYLICGCCHSGLINTLDHAAQLMNGARLRGILGGLHLIGASEERLRHTIEGLRAYDPDFIAPFHCAGARETAVLYSELGEKVRFLSIGDTLEL